MPIVVWVVAAGALGVLSRFLAVRWLGPAPLPIFIVNLIGCFSIGIAYALLTEPLDPKRSAWGIAIAAGFLGGFTTFSSYALDTLLLWEGGRRGLALAYFTLSPVLGLGSAACGLALGRHLLSVIISSR